MRDLRIAALAILLATVGACRFTLDRELASGEVRAVLGVRGDKGFEPVKGAKLRLVGTRIEGTSDDKGRVVLRGVPPAKWSARAQSGEGAAERALLLRDIEVKAIAGGKADGVDLGQLALEAVGAIEGTVVNGAEKLPKALVAAAGGASARAGDDGSFRLGRLPVGEYALSIALDSGATTGAYGTVSVKVVAGKASAVTLDVGALQPAQAGRVRGRVQAPDGDWANVQVTFESLAGGAPQVATTDADGAFESELPGGVYRVSARRTGSAGVVVEPVTVNGDVELPLLLLGDAEEAKDDLDGDGLPDAKTLVLEAPSTVRADEDATFRITARDAKGEIAIGYRGTVKVTSDDPAAADFGQVKFTPEDAGTRTVTLRLKTAGPRRISLSDDSVPPLSATLENVSVESVAPPVLSLRVTAPATVVAGEEFKLHLEVVDAGGQVFPAYRGVVHVSSVAPDTFFDSEITFDEFRAGVADVDVTSYTVGTVAFTLLDESDPPLTAGAEVELTPGAFGKLKVELLGTNFEEDASFGVAVTATDAHDNVLKDFTGTVAIASNSLAVASVSPPSHEYVAGDEGRFVFTGHAVGAGSTEIVATSGAVSGEVAVTVSPAALYTLHVTSPLLADDVFADATTTVRVQVRTAQNTVHTGFSGVVTIEPDDPFALPKLLSFTQANAGVMETSMVLVRPGVTKLRLSTDKVTATHELIVREKLPTLANLTIPDPVGECFQVELDASHASGRPVDLAAEWFVGTNFPTPARLLPTAQLGLKGVPLPGDGTARHLTYEWDPTADGVPAGTPVNFRVKGANGAGSVNAETSFTWSPFVPRVAASTASTLAPLSTLALGDLDRDGVPDLAGALPTGFALRKGSRQGTFTNGSDGTVQWAPTAIAIGNVRGSTARDLVFTSANPPALHVLVGDGTLAGGTTEDLSLGSTGDTTRPVVADLNRDGRDDVVVAAIATPQLYVLNGADSTALAPGQPIGIAADPSAIATGDLDRDGWLDVVVAHRTGGTLSLFFGSATGLASTVQISALAPSRDLALADFDLDGKLDLVTLDADRSSLRFRKGAGTRGATAFGAETTVATNVNADRIAPARWVRDVAPELLAWASDGSPKVVAGIGRSATPLLVTVPSADGTFGAADLDGDGLDDLVASTASGVTGLLSNSQPCRRSLPTSPFMKLAEAPSLVATGDLNGDGRADVVTASNANREVLVQLSTGEGAFTKTATITPTADVRRLLVADGNGDGVSDLVLVREGVTGIDFYEGRGDGTFEAVATTLGSETVDALALTDVTRDGRPDLVTAQFSNGFVRFWVGDGQGGFSSFDAVTLGRRIVGLVVEDVDRDGTRDLVLAEGDAMNLVVRTGSSSWRQGADVALDVQPLALFDDTQDVDADGTQDVGVLAAAGAVRFVSPAKKLAVRTTTIGDTGVRGRFGGKVGNELVAFVSAGSNAPLTQLTLTTTTTSGMIASDVVPNDLAVADIDEDGVADAIVAEPAGVRLVRSRNVAPVAAASMGDARSITTGDWDRDGKADVVAGIGGTASAELLRGSGTGALFPRQNLFGGSGNGVQSAPEALSDLDLDGAPDILIGLANVNGVSIGWGGLANGLAAGVDRTTGDRISVAGQWISSVGVADLDANGRPDFAVFSEQAMKIAIVRATGARQWSYPAPLDAPSDVRAMLFTDVDDDGLADLVIGGGAPARLDILKGNGDGTFSTPTTTTLAAGVSSFGPVRDYDGDGRPDVVAHLGDRLALVRLLGNGAVVETLPFPANVRQLRAGDTDGDGRPEVLAILDTSRLLARVPVRADGAFSQAEFFGVPGQPLSLGVADFDNDGVDDLIAALQDKGGQLLDAR